MKRVWSHVELVSSSMGYCRLGTASSTGTYATLVTLGFSPVPAPADTTICHSWRPSSGDRPYSRAPCAYTAAVGVAVTPHMPAVSEVGRPEACGSAVKLAHTTCAVD